MTRVFLADALPYERSALRLMLLDLGMEVVGEAGDWENTLASAPATGLEMLLVEWSLLPIDFGIQPMAKLREACPGTIVVVLISHLDIRQQAAISAGADMFISKGYNSDLVAHYLRCAAAKIHLV